MTVQEILDLYKERLVGFREARSLLTTAYPEFSTIRDNDLDDETEAHALSEAEEQELHYREQWQKLKEFRESQAVDEDQDQEEE